MALLLMVWKSFVERPSLGVYLPIFPISYFAYKTNTISPLVVHAWRQCLNLHEEQPMSVHWGQTNLKPLSMHQKSNEHGRFCMQTIDSQPKVMMSEGISLFTSKNKISEENCWICEPRSTSWRMRMWSRLSKRCDTSKWCKCLLLVKLWSIAKV